MKAVVLSSQEFPSPHFETDLEIAERHSTDGDSVIFLVCEGNLEICSRNVNHRRVICSNCRTCKDRGVNLLSKVSTVAFFDLQYGSVGDPNLFFENRVISNLDELKAIKYKVFDIGFAVASFVVDYYGEIDLDLTKSQSFLKKLFTTSAKAFDWFDLFLQKEKPDVVYLFNGRITIYKAMVAACIKNNVNFYTHERGGDFERFSLFKNTIVNDIKGFGLLLENNKKSKNIQEIFEAGKVFFTNKARGIEANWYSFVEGQTTGEVDKIILGKKKVVSIFTTSDFEMAAIDSEWDRKLYPDQCLGIQRICKDVFDEDKTIFFIIRIHPNLAKRKPKELERYRAIKQENCLVVFPDSKISSYELLFKSDIVLTFGSTMGVEATYWGKPSILAGRSFYESLNAVFKARSHRDVVSGILNGVPLGDKQDALLYGGSFALLGEKFRFVKLFGINRAEFKGVNVFAPTLLYSLAQQFYCIIKRITEFFR